LLLDMLVSDGQGNETWFSASDGWHTSHQAAPNWESGSTAALAWPVSLVVGAPGGFGLVYEAKSGVISQGQQATLLVPFSLTCEVIALSVGVVLGLWLLVSLTVMRRYYRSRRAALEAMSLAFLPALGGEGLLFVLAREPQLPQPFPYTPLWGVVLLLLVGAGYLLLWLHICLDQKTEKIVNRFLAWVRESRPLSILRSEAFLRDMKDRLPAKVAYLLRVLRVHWPIILIVALAAPLVWYGLGYEPYWQDELVSYLVAKSITVNGLPLLPSGFVYPKGELYSYLLALSMKIFGVQNGALRIVSAIEYTITVPLLYRVGCYFFNRRVAILAAAILAFSPQEIMWGHQIRMYQQAQMFVLLTVFLFYKAIQERQRVHLVYVAMGVLLATYLSHEETFIILPALLICVLLASWQMRDPKHRLPEVLYQKHWWYAAALGICVIGIQLAIVQSTHPPVLGSDSSTRPEVQLTTDNLYYYLNLLFFPAANDPSFNNSFIANITSTIQLNSILALLGCLLAWRSRDIRIKYCALFLIIGFLTMLFVFTMQADRYFYPLLPFYYLIGAYALVTLVQALWRFACSDVRQADGQSVKMLYQGSYVWPLRILIGVTAAFTCVSVLVSLMLPLDSYNLFVSRVAGLPYYRHLGDYQDVQQYMQGHLREGDTVISVIPDTLVLYYVGRSDYFISINRALFLFEQNGHIVDTYTGQVALLRESDLQAVLARHGRIWIISGNNSYQSGFLKRFVLPPDFHIVFEGTASIIYLRGG
jgi:4-amino-4-deoxy-L-arabinose transferase-like glycosyltransferase